METLHDKLENGIYPEGEGDFYDGFNEAKQQAITIASRHQLEAGERAWRVMDKIDQYPNQIPISIPGHVWGIPTDIVTDFISAMLEEIFPCGERLKAIRESRLQSPDR